MKKKITSHIVRYQVICKGKDSCNKDKIYKMNKVILKNIDKRISKLEDKMNGLCETENKSYGGTI